MQLTVVNFKKYKQIFFVSLIVNVIAVNISYFFVKNGTFSFEQFYNKPLAMPVLIGMIALAWMHTILTRKKVDKLTKINDFERRVVMHERIYWFRMLWYLFSCIVCCILFILVTKKFFLYYAIFNVVFLLLLYPNKAVFKKELRNEEIIFN